MSSEPEARGGAPFLTARRRSALAGGVEGLRQTLAGELEAAARAGLDAAGADADALGRVLVHRRPSGEVHVVRRLEPFRWTLTSPEEA